jgi:hypothetical protein
VFLSANFASRGKVSGATKWNGSRVHRAEILDALAPGEARIHGLPTFCPGYFACARYHSTVLRRPSSKSTFGL